MQSKSRLWCWLCIIVGGLGVVICLIAIAFVWNVRQRLDQTVEKTFDRAEAALLRVENRAGLTNQRIGGVRQSLDNLDHRVQQWVADRQDIAPAEAADIDEIERNIRAGLAQIQAWVGFMRSSMELVEQLFEMLDSTSAFVQDDSRTVGDLIASLRAGQQEIETAAVLFAEVQQGLIEIRQQSDREESAKKINTLTSRIASSLLKLAGLGKRFETGVGSLREQSSAWSARIRSQLLLIAAASTLLLFWMAAGQVGLLILGRRGLTS